MGETGIKSDQLGHRKRLRERFLKDLGSSMPDYELLELILTQAIPRGDVKPLAKRLIKVFGSYANVLSASTASLNKIDGIGEATIVAIKLSQQSALRLLKQEAFSGHILENWDKLLDYIQASMSREKTEQLRVLYLNQKNHLLADDIQSNGTINHTAIYPREIIKHALNIGAVSVIIIHNHPSGDPKPSSEDIAMTKELRDAGHTMGITLHDHIIVGRAEYVSFKGLDLI